jgi:hypothetical protein
MITIHIVSHPVGADVLIAGTKIGVTPLDKPLKRGMKLAQLTIHLNGYVDVNSKIDLGGDLSKDVLLKPIASVEATPDNAGSDDPKPQALPKPPVVEHKVVAPPTKPVEHKVVPPSVDPQPHKATPVEHTKAVTSEHKATSVKPKCDPPGQQNPFETSCNGGPCPVCKTP